MLVFSTVLVEFTCEEHSQGLLLPHSYLWFFFLDFWSAYIPLSHNLPITLLLLHQSYTSNF